MVKWYELYVCCPICFTSDNQCKANEKSYWKHKDCSGWIEISEDVDLRCDYCQKSSYILKWQFYCSKHGEYKSINSMRLHNVLAIITDSGNIPDNITKKMMSKVCKY